MGGRGEYASLHRGGLDSMAETELTSARLKEKDT